MTQDEMNILVPEKLRMIEEEFDVKVLLSVESGSRAWGFASPDSDFDVRFIYKRPKDHYLHLQKTRDVIELPVDDTWDVNGWDLDKTLRLLFKSNPTLFEWMQSPICYRRTDFIDRIAPLMQDYFSPKNMIYHYLNTARAQVKAYLQDDFVIAKKYFYAIRPLLACEWVADTNTAPPVLFDDLVKAYLPESLRAPLDYLLDIKLHSEEKTVIPSLPEMNSYIEKSIAHFDFIVNNMPKEEWKDWDALNIFFLSELSNDE